MVIIIDIADAFRAFEEALNPVKKEAVVIGLKDAAEAMKNDYPEAATWLYKRAIVLEHLDE